MRTPERSLSPPGWRTVQDGLTRVRGAFAVATLPVKILMIVAACVLAVPAALIYAPFAVWAGRRTLAASLSVALWAAAIAGAETHVFSIGPRIALLVIILAVVAAAHAGSLGRWYVPCRTVAWTLAWALTFGILMSKLWPSERAIGPAFAALIACVVLGWRLAKSWQDTRQYGRQQARGAALAAPHSWPPPRVPRGGGGPGRPRAGPRPGGPVTTADHPAGRHPNGNGRVTAAEAVRAGQAAGDGPRGQTRPDAPPHAPPHHPH